MTMLFSLETFFLFAGHCELGYRTPDTIVAGAGNYGFDA